MALVIKSDVAVMNTTNVFNIYDAKSGAELASDYEKRVIADSGVVVDKAYLLAVCNFLAEKKLAGKVHTIVSANLGVKMSGTAVSKLYNLVSDYDMEFALRTKTSSPFSVEDRDVVRNPLFVQGTRSHVYFNTLESGGNTNSNNGNILIQDERFISIDKSLSVLSVVEPATLSQNNPNTINHHLFDFGLIDSNNAVAYAYSTNSTDGSNITRVLAYTVAADDGSAGKFNATPMDSNPQIMPAMRKDAVIHNYIQNKNLLHTEVKQSLNSDVYTDRASAASFELSAAFNSKRNLTIGTRSTRSVNEVTFTNLRLYDTFVMHDISFEQGIEIREFIEIQLKNAWGGRV